MLTATLSLQLRQQVITKNSGWKTQILYLQAREQLLGQYLLVYRGIKISRYNLECTDGSILKLPPYLKCFIIYGMLCYYMFILHSILTHLHFLIIFQSVWGLTFGILSSLRCFVTFSTKFDWGQTCRLSCSTVAGTHQPCRVVVIQ